MSETVKKRTPRSKASKAVVAAAAETTTEAPAPAPVAAPAPQISAPSGPPRVDTASFWRMQHAGASMRAAKAEAETARMKKLYILALLDSKNRVLDAEKEQDKARKLAEQHENTYLSLKRYLEERIGKPLANVAIDPDTGAVTDIPSSK